MDCFVSWQGAAEYLPTTLPAHQYPYRTYIVLHYEMLISINLAAKITTSTVGGDAARQTGAGLAAAIVGIAAMLV